MTLANMRANGVCSLSITCELCHHTAVMTVDKFPDQIVVSSFRTRVLCTCCGIVGADLRPNSREQPSGESLKALRYRALQKFVDPPKARSESRVQYPYAVSSLIASRRKSSLRRSRDVAFASNRILRRPAPSRRSAPT